jgi:hypothetical protein
MASADFVERNLSNMNKLWVMAKGKNTIIRNVLRSWTLLLTGVKGWLANEKTKLAFDLEIQDKFLPQIWNPANERLWV